MQCEKPVNTSECETINFNKGGETILRVKSDEYIDEYYFVTVMQGHKILVRSFSKTSNNSSERDLQGYEQKFIVCITSKSELPKQFANWRYKYSGSERPDRTTRPKDEVHFCLKEFTSRVTIAVCS